MSIRHATTLLCSLLFLSGAASLPEKDVVTIPVFISTVITCENNEPNIQLLERVIEQKEKDLLPLQEKQKAKKISKEENVVLYEKQMEVLNLIALMQTRRAFVYYCDHLEEFPSPEEPEIDLKITA